MKEMKVGSLGKENYRNIPLTVEFFESDLEARSEILNSLILTTNIEYVGGKT